MEVGVLFQGTSTVQHIPLREAEWHNERLVVESWHVY